MTSPDAASDIRTAIDTALAEFVDRRRAELEPLGPQMERLLDAAGEFVVGGKRLRPLFAIAGWRIAGGGDAPGSVVSAAAALEWLQASALVHDDLIDASDTRRGKPSIHRAFATAHADDLRLGSPDAFGTAAAVLIGDLMLSWCDQMVRESGLDDAAANAALAVLDACKNEVVAGQFLDVEAQTHTSVSVDDVLRVMTYKSAKYTVERPLHMGARMAGADSALLDRLTAVALPLGRAFQMRDDVLGVFGDPALTGKPAGDDLREGKRTMLIARTLELTDDDGRDVVSAQLGTADAVPAISELIVSSGALAAVEEDIASQVAEARSAMAALGDVADAELSPLLERATARQS